MIQGGEKVESNQVAKVKKKVQLEQELSTLEQRSRSQGGRTLAELEKAERARREHEERERAAIQIQKVFRGTLVREGWDPEVAKEQAALRKAEEEKKRQEEEE